MTVEEFEKTIEAGVVYYFSDPNIISGEPHYSILLNHTPQKETFLIFVPATTLDIWSATAAGKHPKETVIDLNPDQCKFLKHASLFDCNRPIVRHINVLTTKAVTGSLKIKGKVSVDIVERLRLGVLMSRLVTGKIKKLLQ
ncbi:MAG: hypothetical protein AAB691_03235 [Patescibacteria group bacterium]